MKIREEFSAKRVLGNHKVWKANTEKELEKKIYRTIIKEIHEKAKNYYWYGKVIIAPFEEMKREYTPVVSRRKYSVAFTDKDGDIHKHYITIEYGHYGYFYEETA